MNICNAYFGGDEEKCAPVCSVNQIIQLSIFSSQKHFPGPILWDLTKITFKEKLIFVRVEGKGVFKISKLPHSQFPLSCVCERFIYYKDQSIYLTCQTAEFVINSFWKEIVLYFVRTVVRRFLSFLWIKQYEHRRNSKEKRLKIRQ